jgi:transcriptional regulator with XRE-family HTH domain
LKEARLAAGLTQEALGIAAGIDEAVARTRINRYERGVNEADERTAGTLAKALGVPLASLYADTPVMAKVIEAVAQLPAREQKRIADELQALVQEKCRKKPTG